MGNGGLHGNRKPVGNATTLSGYHASLTPAATSIPVSGGGATIADDWLSTTIARTSQLPVAKTVGTDVTNSTTTLADVTGLGWSIGASETWVYQIELDIGNLVDSSTGFILSVNAPAGASGVLRLWLYKDDLTPDSSGGVWFKYNNDPINSTPTVYPGGFGSGSTTDIQHVRGTLHVVNGVSAGTVQLQFACNTVGDDLTVKQGSFGIGFKQ